MFGLNEKVVDGLTWSDIGGDICSLFCFILWVVQILRSLYYYYYYGKHARSQMIAIHLVLFTANILYFCYELITNNSNPTVLIFTMRYLLNLSIIWCHQLICKEEGVVSKFHYLYLFMKLALTACFIASFFTGTYGIACDKDHLPGG